MYMMEPQNLKRNSSVSLETPWGDLNSNATGEGESMPVKGSCDDGKVIPDGGYQKQTSRNSSKMLSRKKKKMQKNDLYIGTWNVQTMLELGKLYLLVKELERSKMNITGLCETRWSGQGLFTIGEHTVIYSGNRKGGSNGVAIVLDKKHAVAQKSYDPINDRLLIVKINTKHAVLNIIQAYAPTSKCTEEEIENFYNDLQTIRDKIPKKEICIVMGDFNAKVGVGVDTECGIGPYGLGERNERGDMLAQFCQANEMNIANTFFKQPMRRRYTWISPGDRCRNQIDYIIIDRSWKSIVLNAKTKPGTDCDTDHILVASKLRIKILKKPKTKLTLKFDTSKFENPDLALEFSNETSNRFLKLLEVWDENDSYPNEIWMDMKNMLTTVSEEKLGREKKKKKAKPYISQEVIDLAARKSKARKQGEKERYSELKKEIKRKIRRDKANWLAHECSKINAHNENRKSRELFRQINNVKKSTFKATNQCINNKDGQTLTEPEDVLDRWNEYGASLFSKPDSGGNNLEPNLELAPEDMEPEPLLSEVKSAINELKCRKSPGLDNIPGELLKHSGEGGLKAMHHLCCKIWKTCQWPTDWKLQEFVMLHKGGNVKDCNNYRTIALISHASKILLIIILNRLKPKVEEELSDCQAGYRKNRGTIDMLFVLQILIEKIRNTDQEMFIIFIDYSKAFDSVIHQSLFFFMIKMGFPKHLVLLIASLYNDQKATIRWNGQNCKFFDITKGVRQGCILSPHLFSIYTEHIMREADIEDMGVKIGGRNLTNLRYADDTGLLADNITGARRILHRVDRCGREAGLKLNSKKTKVMHVDGRNNDGRDEIRIDNVPLENVEDFKYLGSVKTQDGTCTKDIKMRIGMAKNSMVQLNNIWKDHSITVDLKIKLLKCLVWPVMLYGCESWTMKKDDDRRIEAAELWFYRRLLRVSWTEKRSNESILNELGTSRILLDLIKRRKLKYVGHAIRNGRTDLMSTVLQGKVEGKRNKGRPPASLGRNITDISGKRLQEVVRLSSDRECWKNFVRTSCTPANTAFGDADR